jgi:hypothetical protein
MTEHYKGNHIHVIAWHIAERGWTPIVYVTDFTAPNKADVKHLMFSGLYATEKEVQQIGLSTAKKWIDEGKPDLSGHVDAGYSPPSST